MPALDSPPALSFEDLDPEDQREQRAWRNKVLRTTGLSPRRWQDLRDALLDECEKGELVCVVGHSKGVIKRRILSSVDLKEWLEDPATWLIPPVEARFKRRHK